MSDGPTCCCTCTPVTYFQLIRATHEGFLRFINHPLHSITRTTGPVVVLKAGHWLPSWPLQLVTAPPHPPCGRRWPPLRCVCKHSPTTKPVIPTHPAAHLISTRAYTSPEFTSRTQLSSARRSHAGDAMRQRTTQVMKEEGADGAGGKAQKPSLKALLREVDDLLAATEPLETEEQEHAVQLFEEAHLREARLWKVRQLLNRAEARDLDLRSLRTAALASLQRPSLHLGTK